MTSYYLATIPANNGTETVKGRFANYVDAEAFLFDELKKQASKLASPAKDAPAPPATDAPVPVVLKAQARFRYSTLHFQYRVEGDSGYRRYDREFPDADIPAIQQALAMCETAPSMATSSKQYAVLDVTHFMGNVFNFSAAGVLLATVEVSAKDPVDDSDDDVDIEFGEDGDGEWVAQAFYNGYKSSIDGSISRFKIEDDLVDELIALRELGPLGPVCSAITSDS